MAAERSRPRTGRHKSGAGPRYLERPHHLYRNRRVQRLRAEEGSVLGRPQESQSYVTSAGVRQSQAMAQIEVLGIEA
jgi:hypothetical protein